MAIEYRAAPGIASESNGYLEGMVTPFNTEIVIGDLKRGGFKEEIAPGTFTKTLQERDAVLIHNHDTAMPMARSSVPEGQEGHVSFRQETDGFKASALPVDTSYARDVRNLAKAGILGMSFGFEVTKEDWYDDEGRESDPQKGTKRIIREVKFHEASTTAFPAYVSTMGTVSARDVVHAARSATEARAAVPAGTSACCPSCGVQLATEARDNTAPADTGNLEPAKTTPDELDAQEARLTAAIEKAIHNL
jgi:HK97 family phage prohead protease